MSDILVILEQVEKGTDALVKKKNIIQKQLKLPTIEKHQRPLGSPTG